MNIAHLKNMSAVYELEMQCHLAPVKYVGSDSGEKSCICRSEVEKKKHIENLIICEWMATYEYSPIKGIEGAYPRYHRHYTTDISSSSSFFFYCEWQQANEKKNDNVLLNWNRFFFWCCSMKILENGEGLRHMLHQTHTPTQNRNMYLFLSRMLGSPQETNYDITIRTNQKMASTQAIHLY